MRYGLGVVIDTGEGHPRVGQEGALPGFEVRTFYATALDAFVVIAATNHEWATLKPLLDTLNTIAAAKTF